MDDSTVPADFQLVVYRTDCLWIARGMRHSIDGVRFFECHSNWLDPMDACKLMFRLREYDRHKIWTFWTEPRGMSPREAEFLVPSKFIPYSLAYPNVNFAQ